MKNNADAADVAAAMMAWISQRSPTHTIFCTNRSTVGSPRKLELEHRTTHDNDNNMHPFESIHMYQSWTRWMLMRKPEPVKDDDSEYGDEDAYEEGDASTAGDGVCGHRDFSRHMVDGFDALSSGRRNKDLLRNVPRRPNAAPAAQPGSSAWIECPWPSFQEANQTRNPMREAAASDVAQTTNAALQTAFVLLWIAAWVFRRMRRMVRMVRMVRMERMVRMVRMVRMERKRTPVASNCKRDRGDLPDQHPSTRIATVTIELSPEEPPADRLPAYTAHIACEDRLGKYLEAAQLEDIAAICNEAIYSVTPTPEDADALTRLRLADADEATRSQVLTAFILGRPRYREAMLRKLRIADADDPDTC
jgi:hypothetical protein